MNSSENPFQHIEDPQGVAPKDVKDRIEGSQSFIQVVFSTIELYVSNFANSIVAVIRSYSEPEDMNNNIMPRGISIDLDKNDQELPHQYREEEKEELDNKDDSI